MNENWHLQTACELGDGIGHGDIDPRDLCEHFLARIAAHDADHLIYLRTTADRARGEAAAAAARATDGRRRSRLDGVPISWKDLYDTAGVATEGGTPLLAGRVPERDARVLQRATRAGCVCLGKTNTVQFALGGIGSNAATGTPPSAAMTDVPRAPGGSSSGAATSVAHGLAPIGIGSDTGGSVRIPAAWNRLVGLKTSHGVLPLDGVLPLSPSLDTVGPLTKSVADAAEIFTIMAARKPLDLGHASLDGARFLVAESVVWRDIEPEVETAVKDAIARLEAAGATVEWAPIAEFDDIDRNARYPRRRGSRRRLRDVEDLDRRAWRPNRPGGARAFSSRTRHDGERSADRRRRRQDTEPSPRPAPCRLQCDAGADHTNPAAAAIRGDHRP